MVGLTLRGSTRTNKLEVVIPDELKGIDLQIIIIPAEKNGSESLRFFNNEELSQLSSVTLGTPLKDEEDYSKW